MNNAAIYQDIATRTDGSIFLGVVGPVRTGKSTFIKRFMDCLVLPNIGTKALRDRTVDELPQASSGRTIMTTEPKFIPEKAVRLKLEQGAEFNVRLIDCVGYIVPSALGYIEEDQPRMVKTPWYEEEIPFNMAAELGTQKVITEHSTIGLVITTDGTIGDIPRAEYAEAEQRVVKELKQLNKPFVVLLNSTEPELPVTKALANELSEQYGVTVLPVNCLTLNENDISAILSTVLFEFPVRKICVSLPGWVSALPSEHPLKGKLYRLIRHSTENMTHLRQLTTLKNALDECKEVDTCSMDKVDLGTGCATLTARLQQTVFYETVTQFSGISIQNDNELLNMLKELSEIKTKYMRIKGALDEVEATGYGIVMPTLEELKLEEPEIMREGSRYGVRLKASAPSLHLMRANITTEVSPIVGTERQSEDLVLYLLREFEENPQQIWQSDIFGKSLHELVNEGLHTKLSGMPQDARLRLQETVERVINEGCSGLICIIL